MATYSDVARSKQANKNTLGESNPHTIYVRQNARAGFLNLSDLPPIKQDDSPLTTVHRC